MPRKTKQQSQPSLDYVFRPRSIAIAGVSSDNTKFNAGRIFLELLLNSGYKGKLYPLNPGGGQAFGLKNYVKIHRCDIAGRLCHLGYSC